MLLNYTTCSSKKIIRGRTEDDRSSLLMYICIVSLSVTEDFKCCEVMDDLKVINVLKDSITCMCLSIGLLKI